MSKTSFLDACSRLYGRPEKPTVPEVMPLVKEFYEWNPVGGSLHIVLDDANVSDDNVRFCLDHATAKGDRFGVALATVLLRMSRTQRHKLYRGKYR